MAPLVTPLSFYPLSTSPQSLQEEQSSCSSQLVELMMSARVDLVGELPRDLPPGALLSHGSFLINLEGEWGGHGVTGFAFPVVFIAVTVSPPLLSTHHKLLTHSQLSICCLVSS